MRRLVLACAALACLAACASDPEPIEPKAGTSRAPNPSAAPTSTLTPPTLPKVAQRSDATGAANFVLYWVKAADYAAWTGDVDLLEQISADDCAGCNSYLKVVRDTYAAGGYFQEGEQSIRSCKHTLEASEHFFTCRVDTERARSKKSTASAVIVSPAEFATVEYAVKQASGDWLMTQIGLQQ